MKNQTEPCIFRLAQSNIAALKKARLSVSDLPNIFRNAIASTDLNTVLLDIMNFSYGKEVRLRIPRETHVRLKAISARRLCSVQLLLNCVLADYLGAPSSDHGLFFEEITLDRDTYKRVEEVARRRHVTIQLLINSALQGFGSEKPPYGESIGPNQDPKHTPT